MSAPTFRVFISAVSKELATCRHEVARVLRRKGLEVLDQEHFSQGPATLLERLRDYIQQCEAVVLLVGEQCGAFPTDEHAAALGSIRIFDKYRATTGQPRGSYTQWEFLLAKHFDKPTYVFFTDTAHGFMPDAPNPEGADLRVCQQAYRDWIKQTGEHRDALTTPAKLIEDVLVLPFPRPGPAQADLAPLSQPGQALQGARRVFGATTHKVAPGSAGAGDGYCWQGIARAGRRRQDAAGGRVCLAASGRLQRRAVCPRRHFARAAPESGRAVGAVGARSAGKA